MTHLAGLFGCGLLGLALAATAFRLGAFPVRVRYAAVLVAAAAVFFPVGGLSIAGTLRGVTGDLSAATLALAANAIFARLSGRTLIERRELMGLFWLVAAAALFLYPFALGWTPFDPYALGYGSIAFVAALLVATLAAWRMGLKLAVAVVLTGALAWVGGLYESRNLWDYLLDPLAAAYALAVLLTAGGRKLLSERRERAPVV
jgi:hypothetical protein